MRLCPVPLLLVCGIAAAQTLVDAEHVLQIKAAFDSPGAAIPFRCEMKSIRPTLNFGLRFQAGYSVTFPMKQFTGSGHALRMILRITPEGQQASYVTDSVDLPDVPPSKADGVIFGSILVGEGNYSVDARVEDEQHRVCRADWRMHARRQGAESNQPPAMTPGEIATLSSAASVKSAKPDSAAGRLTVLLHAAPLRSRNSVLQPADIQMLTGSLSALLERAPARSVRLVVFNLDRQKELLRRENFAGGDIDSVSRSLSELQLASVDYSVLRDPGGGAAMLAGMLGKELREARPGDSVVLLGPEARIHAPLPRDFERPQSSTRVFYLRYLPGQGIRPAPDAMGGRGGRGGPGAGGGRGGPGRGSGGGPGRGPGPGGIVGSETIQQLVKRFKGVVVSVRTPKDFARAVLRINRR